LVKGASAPFFLFNIKVCLFLVNECIIQEKPVRFYEYRIT